MTEEPDRDEELREAIDTVSQAFSEGRYGEALLMLRPLADAGIAEAMGMLALAYQRGAGVEVDGEKAIELYEKAVEMGDAVAAYHLGMLYQRGMQGVEPNPEAARRYLEQAAQMGFTDPGP